jgi:hypothetical protein
MESSVIQLVPEQPHFKCEFVKPDGTNCGAEALHICSTCKKPKCGEHTSNVDFGQCQVCCEDVGIDVQIVAKHDTDFDIINDVAIEKTYKAKHIQYTGQHWLTNQTAIYEMSDGKLKGAIEYYKTIVKLIEEEQVRRKITKSKQILAANPLGRRIKKAIDGISSVTVEKKVTTRRQKVMDPMEALMAAAAAGKIDLKKLAEMLQQKVAATNLGVPVEKQKLG